MSTHIPATPTALNAQHASRDEREWRVGQVLHSWSMEGLEVTVATRADMQDYIDGLIDVDELVARGLARYGLT